MTDPHSMVWFKLISAAEWTHTEEEPIDEEAIEEAQELEGEEEHADRQTCGYLNVDGSRCTDQEKPCFTSTNNTDL